MVEDPPHAGRLLTRHFVRRFVDNDLLSAHDDRHENIGLAVAALVAVSLFASTLLVTKYILAPGTAGQVAVTTLEDRFFLIALAMIVMALATVAQWEALSLDARDIAILGPLPIRTRQLVAAKAAAVCLYGCAVALALTLAPSVVHPLGSTLKLRIGLVGHARLVAAHFGAALAATAFAFFAVIAVRETLRAVLGQRGFARVSGSVQALLVVALTTAFLLLFGGAAGTAVSLVNENAPQGVTRVTLPALWFLGLAETTIGETVVGSWGAIDDDPSRLYRSRQGRFRDLAQLGLLALGVVAAVGGAAYAWNSRRLPQPQSRRPARHPLRASLGRLASLVVVRDPVARAGFFFTVSVLVRSAPHRLAMSVALAVALALTAATFGGSGLVRPADASSARLSVWALQTFVLMALVVGVRHALALPAALDANWIFRQCWSGNLRSYMTGVHRAVLVAAAIPPVLALMPLHVYMFGASTALIHALTGIVIARLLLAGVLHGHSKPPFISSYVPRGNLKLAPIHLIAAAVFAFSIAAGERASATTALGGGLFTIGLIVASVGIQAVLAHRSRRTDAVLDDVPEASTQTLGLTD